MIRAYGDIVYRGYNFIQNGTNIDFVSKSAIALLCSGIASIGSIIGILLFGLNLGIDFSGGFLVEVKTDKPIEVGTVREQLNTLNLGKIELQEVIGEDTGNIMILRLPKDELTSSTQTTDILAKVREIFGSQQTVDFRRVELVGPKVGYELIRDGAVAVGLSILAIAIYVWFRFEWQFGLGGMLSLLHDVLTTIGLFVVTRIEFNLTSVAALLTIAGYSINDSVVVYDRVRENMQQHKDMLLTDLLNKSTNETLSRTILTSGTTALALIALLIFGGNVLRGFSIAMLWGIVIGTYSSIYVGVPVLKFFNIGERGKNNPEKKVRNTKAKKSMPKNKM